MYTIYIYIHTHTYVHTYICVCMSTCAKHNNIRNTTAATTYYHDGNDPSRRMAVMKPATIITIRLMMMTMMVMMSTMTLSITVMILINKPTKCWRQPINHHIHNNENASN